MTLAAAVESAVHASIVSGCKIRGAAVPYEQDLVAGFVTTGVRTLNTELRKALSPVGLRVRVGGVFCHGTPKVDMGADGRCELGDLLVVTRYTNGPRTTRRALLVQFKKEGGSGATSAQEALYARWPRFDYWRTKGLSGESRSVTPKRAGTGAQFAELGPCPYCRDWAHVCPGGRWSADAWYGKNAPRPLVHELTDLIFGGSGRTFERPVNRRNKSWDRVIHDLLTVTAKRVFRVASRVSAPAGVGSRALAYMHALATERCIPVFEEPPAIWSDARIGIPATFDALLHAELPPEPPIADLSPVDDDDESEGISTLFIEVSESPDELG